MRDGYSIFFEKFGINNQDIIDFGIREAIFIPDEKVISEWEGLKNKIYNGSGIVSIRGYGRDGNGTQNYLDLYALLFEHGNFKKDPTNNAEPKRIIQNLTGCKIGKDVRNYQISHVFGRTKNPFAFAAPWNLVFLPKIVDPFTGHESKGELTEEFQKAFQRHTYERHEKYINEFNALMLDIRDELNDCLEKNTNVQFKNDVVMQFEPINIGGWEETQYKMD